MSRESPRFLVGTSGWSYPHWKGVFYPHDWPKRRWFEYYAREFPAVELNATFYRRFKEQTYYKWRDLAPEGFTYVLKAPRLITHRRYLKGAGEDIREFWCLALLLEDRLGLVLLQLAPGTPYDLDLLKEALLAFGDPSRVAVEFRHNRWVTEDTRALLEQIGATFCAIDSPKMEPLDWVTSDTAYIRLHGRKKWYAHDYSHEELAEIALLAKSMVKKGAKKTYIFFNNDLEGCAPRNARALLEILNE